jgi:hypothetical protein
MYTYGYEARHAELKLPVWCHAVCSGEALARTG